MNLSEIQLTSVSQIWSRFSINNFLPYRGWRDRCGRVQPAQRRHLRPPVRPGEGPRLRKRRKDLSQQMLSTSRILLVSPQFITK